VCNFGDAKSSIMKNILIVDDHFLVCLGLEILVKKVVKNSSVFLNHNFDEAIKTLKTHKIDLLILDLSIPGGKGPDMIRSFCAIQKGIRILICSGRDELTNAPACINEGAYGFLSKDAQDSEAEKAVELVINGKKYVSPAVQLKIIENFMNGQQINKNPLETLSPREREVLNLLLVGHSSKFIGDSLRIKFSTVSTHKMRIFQKLEVENNVELFKKVGHYSEHSF
jgi:two-component system invasion response regulator UvrY